MNLEGVKKLIESCDSVWDLEDKGFEEVADLGIVDQSRWSTYRNYVVKVEDKFYLVCQSSGSTEHQEDYTPLKFLGEVEQKEVTRLEWV